MSSRDLIPHNAHKKTIERAIRKTTRMQKVFCEELAADPVMSLRKAAEKAGYKHPHVAGPKLMKSEHVTTYLGKVLHDRVKRRRLVANDVLEQLRNALYIDPMDMFEPGPNGSWFVKSLDKIPKDIRRCITKLRSVSRTSPRTGEVETCIEIELMSKDNAIRLAMAHLGLDKWVKSSEEEEEDTDNEYMDAPRDLLLQAKSAVDKLRASVNGKVVRREEE